MNKQHILDEIRRLAKDNDGIPVGKQKFLAETEIKDSDWYGKYWVRWGDAVREAGFAANQLTAAYSETWLIEKYIALIKGLGRLPVNGDLRMKARSEKDFPSHTVYGRFGSKTKLLSKVAAYCRTHSGFEDILPLFATIVTDEKSLSFEGIEISQKIGYVSCSSMEPVRSIK